ncbi:MAG: hypothetical protein SFW08_09260 [Gemmatimonadaceae bacterium]|nr:hypothetical protein [Gemmatimonadaceae bacterium]
MLSGLFKAWSAPARRAAEQVISGLHVAPEPADIEWLASLMLRRDEDHAAWELRYARRAVGLLIAERDALNDRTAQEVSAALIASFSRDPHIAADRLEMALAQFQTRLAAYRAAMAKRDGKEPVAARMARELLTFAGAITGDHQAAISRAGSILSGYGTQAADLLRAAYGTAQLPEDVAPSQALG